jgi:predicted transcriptional regulator
MVGMGDLDFFMNDRMKVLQIIYQHQISVEGNSFCPLNQQEIADLVPCSKLKANQIIRELIDAGYVEMIRSRGRYIVTEKGNTVLEI